MKGSHLDAPLIEFKIEDSGLIYAHVVHTPEIYATGKTVVEVQQKLIRAIDAYWDNLDQEES